MSYDLKKIECVLGVADRIIKGNPDLLRKTTDEIFDDLDDGTQEMRRNRWGVMARAAMTRLTGTNINEILAFLYTIKENNLLCEYIGYILQSELNISLLELQIEAHKEAADKKILPFVVRFIEYEKSCRMGTLDIILEIIQDVKDGSEAYQFIQNYAKLVVRDVKESEVLRRFIAGYSEALEQLTVQIGIVLFRKRPEDAEQWTDVLLHELSDHCKRMGICFLYRSTFYGYALFEKHFSYIESSLCQNEQFWEGLIPVYIRYLSDHPDGIYRDQVKGRLMQCKDGSQAQKRICIQELKYCDCDSGFRDGSDVIEQLISTPFGIDNKMLNDLDYYFKWKAQRDCAGVLEQLYRLYKENKYALDHQFLEALPQTCMIFRNESEGITGYWYDRLIHGDKYEFYFSIEIFQKILPLDQLESFLELQELVRSEMLLGMEGILLFTPDENKIADLAFLLADKIKDNELYFEFCKEKIYSNYSSVLTEKAKSYAASNNLYRAELAEKILAYDQEYKRKMQKGYEDKDYRINEDRYRKYQTAMAEQNRKIQEEAREGSFFGRYFPDRKMKYGRKIAFVQTVQKGELKYQVNAYAEFRYSMELPRKFLNYPVEFVYMKLDYLQRRENEVNR